MLILSRLGRGDGVGFLVENLMNLIDVGGMRLSDLTELLESWGEKSFRANQLFRWLHRGDSDNFEEMTDLAGSLRRKLNEKARIQIPRISKQSVASDGVAKWLLDLGKVGVECVLIPEIKRMTLCISSQVGCAIDCSFCATGKRGFKRNLSTSEIIGQLRFANRYLGSQNRVSNVVFMGMGEPLANFENVNKALDIMLDDNAYGLSKRRLTISTAGIIPGIYRLARRNPVSLAVSLHAPVDELRDQLVPINRKYPLKELIKACFDYIPHAPRPTVMFEYVMIRDLNDSVEMADKLGKLLRDLPCKINLIPFNPFSLSPHRRSTDKQIQIFRDVLHELGLVTTVRKTRGNQIDAACGQLAGLIDRRSALTTPPASVTPATLIRLVPAST